MLRLIQRTAGPGPCRGFPGRLSISLCNGDCAMRSCLRTAECAAQCSDPLKSLHVLQDEGVSRLHCSYRALVA
eukprot:2821071-Rhodomonas_salina.3